MSKIIVYTACIGPRSIVQELTFEDNSCNYIAFTNPSHKLKTWKEIYVSVDKQISNRMSARLYKTGSHNLFPDCDYTIWIDSSLILKKSPAELVRKFLEETGADVAAYPHPRRNCLYEEAKTCMGDQKEVFLPKDNPDIIRKQVKGYLDEGFPPNIGLFENGLLLRRNNDNVAKFNKYWFDQIINGTTEDQISFPYSLQKQGISSVFIYPGKVGHCEFTEYVGHAINYI